MGRCRPVRDLVSIAQRIQNLTYVLVMDPCHQAARAAMEVALDAAGAEGKRRSSQRLQDTVCELRFCITNRDGCQARELADAAAHFHEAALGLIGSLDHPGTGDPD